MNKVIYYTKDNHKIGEVDCPDYQLSVRFVAEHCFGFAEATNALYLGENLWEFHLYSIEYTGLTLLINLIT